MKRPGTSGIPPAGVCYRLMERYNMPPHVIRHCRVVCGVALYLSGRLSERGVVLNRDLIQAAGLLHDITKAHSFHRPLDHALTGSKLLRRLGYPSVAEVVRQHVRLSSTRPPGRLSEPEIVNYADKRVVDDRITSLDERLAYIYRRYGQSHDVAARIERNAARIREVERELFRVIGGQPSQIQTDIIEKEWIS
jgi:putative nucleotidyltransferase with HDIG domain